MEMKRKHPLASRVLAICLVVMMVFSLMPAGFGQFAYADNGSKEKLYEVTINVVPKEASVTFYSDENAKVPLTADQVQDNGVVESAHQYVITVPEGRYSYRSNEEGTDLGGMCFDVPFDDEIMFDPETGGGVASGKGLVMTLLRTNVYTNDAKIMHKGDYTVHAIPAGLPEAVCGAQYLDAENRVVTPMMLVARGNALVYQFNLDINGELAENYAVSQLSNVTLSEGMTRAQSYTFFLNSTVYHTITAPEGAKAQVFKQLNNFNVAEVPVKTATANNDGTITYKYATPGGGNLTYRVSMKDKITRAGYFGRDPENIVVTFDENENQNTLENKAETSYNQGRMESSTVVNVNEFNNLTLGVNETFRLRAYRGAWEIINTDTENIMIEPDFNYEIVSGEEHIKFNPITDKCTGNAGVGMEGNWMDIQGISEGIAILEVSYDAILIGGKGTSNDGLYGATNPQRKSLIVINVGGQDTALEFIAEGDDHIWDTEYDTVYFVEDTGSITFNATLATKTPEKVELSTDRGNTWKEVSVKDGKYVAEGLVPGNNIFKFTTGNQVAYQVVRGAKVTYTIENKSHDYEDLYMVGDKIAINFEGLFIPIFKMSGIYNPGFSGGGHKIVYGDAEGCSQSPHGVQYQFITDHELTVTLEESGPLTLSDGYIDFEVMGKVDIIGGHRTLSDSGCGTNFSASSSRHMRSILPDITLNVEDEKFVEVSVKTNAQNPEVVITDESGKVMDTTEGVYSLKYGKYKYVINAEGFARLEETFYVLPKDGESKVLDITMRKLEDTEWDGRTKEEAPQKDGVYQLSKASHLAWFADQVNAGTGSDWDAVLVTDLSLGTENQWAPMMNYSGTFDGAGHYITDLYITLSKDQNNVGLFGSIVDGAVIKDLGVDGIVNTGDYRCSSGAGIVGNAGAGSKIERCKNMATIVGRNANPAGGVVGLISAQALLQDCYNTGHIEGYRVGGILGEVTFESGYRKPKMIMNCYNVGTVKTAYGMGGGIYYEDKGKFSKNCYYLEGCCNFTSLQSGNAVSADAMKTQADALGTSFINHNFSYNDGYPILVWEESRVMDDAAKIAEAELNSYKNLEEYRALQQDELKDLISEAVAAIEKAETLKEVEQIVETTKAAMDKIKTDAQMKAEEEANKPADTPTDKPADTPTDKPTDVPTDKPADTPADTPATPEGDKPADTPATPDADKPADKPADTPTTPDADKPAEDQPTDEPATPDADEPADKEPVVEKQQLKAPAKVKASNVASTGKIKLTWGKVTGAKEYKVYRATSKNGKYTLMKTVKKTSYINTSAKAGKTYFYKVKAIAKDKDVLSSKYSKMVKATCDLKAPVVTAKNKAKKQVKLTWKKVDGAKKYTVYRATSKNGKYKAIKTTTKLSFTNKNLKKGKTYYYKVKAIAKNSAANSAFSTVDKCKVKK